MSSSISLNFIINNVKECNLIKRDQKLIQYFKENIGLTGVLFLQENHSSSKVEQKRKKDSKGQVFFPHGKTSSCNVLTAQFGKETFDVKKQETYKEVRISILNVSVNDYEYILINLYNTNTEKEQINVFSKMFTLLKKFDINKKNTLL